MLDWLRKYEEKGNEIGKNSELMIKKNWFRQIECAFRSLKIHLLAPSLCLLHSFRSRFHGLVLGYMSNVYNLLLWPFQRHLLCVHFLELRVNHNVKVQSILRRTRNESVMFSVSLSLALCLFPFGYFVFSLQPFVAVVVVDVDVSVYKREHRTFTAHNIILHWPVKCRLKRIIRI